MKLFRALSFVLNTNVLKCHVTTVTKLSFFTFELKQASLLITIHMKLSTRLQLEFSELREHKFRHNFNCIDPMCLCGNGVEDNEHSLLHCQRFFIHRTSYLDNISHLINRSTTTLSSSLLCNILLFSDNQFNDITNKLIAVYCGFL